LGEGQGQGDLFEEAAGAARLVSDRNFCSLVGIAKNGEVGPWLVLGDAAPVRYVSEDQLPDFMAPGIRPADWSALFKVCDGAQISLTRPHPMPPGASERTIDVNANAYLSLCDSAIGGGLEDAVGVKGNSFLQVNRCNLAGRVRVGDWSDQTNKPATFVAIQSMHGLVMARYFSSHVAGCSRDFPQSAGLTVYVWSKMLAKG
jgi:hypothetical protein